MSRSGGRDGEGLPPLSYALYDSQSLTNGPVDIADGRSGYSNMNNNNDDNDNAEEQDRYMDLGEGSLLSGGLGEIGGIEDEVSSAGDNSRSMRSESELIALVNYREQLITRVVRIIDLSSSMTDKKLPVLARDLVNLSNELQEIGLKCVQRIIQWTFVNATTTDPKNPKPFLWHDGQPYLCKMLNDLDFIAEELPPSLREHGNFRKEDPLFISKTHNCSLSYKRAVFGGTLVILDAVARASKEDGGRSRCSSSTWFSEDEELSRARRMHFAKYGSNDNIDTNSRGVGGGKASKSREESSSAGRNANVKLKPLDGTHTSSADASSSSRPAALSKRSMSRGAEGEGVVTFKGRKLYRRGKLLGEGAYAMVNNYLIFYS